MTIKAKVIVSLLLCGILITGLVLSVGCAGQPAVKQPIKIGVIIPATGALAEHGKYATRGVQMALNEINAAGGVLGRPIQIVQVDDKNAPDTAVSVANSLVYDDQVSYLVGCLISSTTDAVSQWAKGKKILYIGFGVSDYLTMDKGHRYFFRGGQESIIQQKGNVENLKGRGFKKVWTLAPDYAYGHQAIDAAVALLKAQTPDVQIVGQSWPPLTETDFGPYINQIKGAGADALYSALFGGTQVSFVKQAVPFVTVNV